jgi:ABC-type phosphate/phosphonate transport system ATPase subunit
MELFKKINEEDGVTIIQVTHSEKNAAYGKRIINLLDGRIEKTKIVFQKENMKKVNRKIVAAGFFMLLGIRIQSTGGTANGWTTQFKTMRGNGHTE